MIKYRYIPFSVGKQKYKPRQQPESATSFLSKWGQQQQQKPTITIEPSQRNLSWTNTKRGETSSET